MTPRFHMGTIGRPVTHILGTLPNSTPSGVWSPSQALDLPQIPLLAQHTPEWMDAKKIQYVSGNKKESINLACVPSISETLVQHDHRIRRLFRIAAQLLIQSANTDIDL